MTRIARRALVLLATTLGLAAATAARASAGLALNDHCEPPKAASPPASTR